VVAPGGVERGACVGVETTMHIQAFCHTTRFCSTNFF